MNYTRNTLLGVALASMMSAAAFAGGNCDCCDRCDAAPVCTLVKTTKTLEVTCFMCECEDFCVPGKSERCGRNCELACTCADGCCDGGCDAGCCDECTGDMGCDCCDSCCGDRARIGEKKFVWYDWIPGCATSRTRKKLMKRTATKEVCSYKWEIKQCCDSCDDAVEGAFIEPGAKIPPLPKVAANMKIKYRNPHNVPVSFEQVVSPAKTAGTKLSKFKIPSSFFK